MTKRKKGWREPINAIAEEDEHIVLFLLDQGFQQHSIATLFGVNPGRISTIATKGKKSPKRDHGKIGEINRPGLRSK